MSAEMSTGQSGEMSTGQKKVDDGTPILEGRTTGVQLELADLYVRTKEGLRRLGRHTLEDVIADSASWVGFNSEPGTISPPSIGYDPEGEDSPAPLPASINLGRSPELGELGASYEENTSDSVREKSEAIAYLRDEQGEPIVDNDLFWSAVRKQFESGSLTIQGRFQIKQPSFCKS